MPYLHRRAALACALAALTAAMLPSAAIAGDADVIDAKVRATGTRVYAFDVTIRSKDRGWDDYAERFEIVTPDGTLLGTRILLHPHEDEQPFARSLDDVRIPPGIERVTVRAWMKRGGKEKAAGGAVLDVRLP